MRPISIISNIAGLSGTVVERRPGDAVVTLTSTTDPIVASAPLVTMRSAVYLGSAPFTTIALDSIVIPKVIATGDNGRLTVIGECRIEARQAGRGQGFAVSVERVDADGVYLDLTVLTHDPVTIRMVDALGCIRHVPLDGVLQPGRYRITVPANDMPSGLMLIDVIHAGLRRTVPVILVR